VWVAEAPLDPHERGGVGEVGNEPVSPR